MSETPVELIVAAFNDEQGAEAAYKELKQAKKQHLIGIKDAAVIRRDKKNKLHIKDIHDMGGGKGAGIGALIGGSIGLILGPGAILTGAAGALIGGFAAKLSDGGFPDERLKEIGAGLKPETSAIVAVIEHRWVDDLQNELAEAGAQVMTQSIAADISAQLEQGKDVAYSALETDESTTISRIAVGEDSAEVTEVVLSEGTVLAQSAVATSEGVAYEGMLATEDGVALIADDEGVVAGVLEAAPEEDAPAEAVEGEVEEENSAEDASNEEQAA